MIEGWTIFHIPEYLYVVRRRYGYGRTHLYVRGSMIARTLEEARDLLPRGRDLQRFTSQAQDVVEVWFTPTSAEAIRKLTASRRDAPPLD